MFVLLGAALPVVFLSWVDRYLYYLRPVELIPTYGTAWLLLAALVLPFSLFCGLILNALGRSARLARVRQVVVVLLIAVAAMTPLAAVAYGAIVWIRSFGVLAGVHALKGIVLFSIGASLLLAATPRGRQALLGLYSTTKFGMVLGALALVSLPFFGWNTGSLPPSNADVPASTDSRPRPHILLVTIDALSAQHMSLYGASRETTPNLDAFARTATTFDDAYANANFTTAGVSSIVTATRPWTHRAMQLPSWPIDDARRNSLPEVLEQAGYQTAYVSTNPLAGGAKLGLGAYFKVHMGDRAPLFSVCSDAISAALPYDCAATDIPLFSVAQILWARIHQILLDPLPNWHHDPRVAIRPALEWLAAADKRTPIFLWIHLLPPHSPYAAPAPWLGQFDSSSEARDAAHSDPETAYLSRNVPQERVRVLDARYDESVKYVDFYVGELLSQATKLLGDNTVVIVSADHGESFEHGYGMHTGPALYQSLIHIPLIIHIPSQTAGSHISAPAEQVDIGPTLAELAGIRPPSSWEGRSLLEARSLPATASPAAAKPVFAMNFEENRRDGALANGSVAVVDGQWKLIHYMGALHYPLMPRLHDELYDIAGDPGELEDKISERPDEAERLRKLIAAQLIAHGGPLRRP